MSQPRLAYLLKKFPRLSETFILNELLAQERRGRELHVLSRRTPDDEPRHPELARLKAQVEVLPHYREIDPWDTLFSEEWESEEVFSRVGRTVREGKSWGHPRFPSLMVEALYLLRRTSALGIDHIHTHFATDSAVVALIVNLLGGPTFSITAHAKDIYRETVDYTLLSIMFQRASFVVTVCDANANYMRERLTAEAGARVHRLYNGIDLSAYTFNGGPREEGHVVSIGRLVEKKGFFVLLDAARLLVDRGVPFRLTLVGDGEERERIAQRVVELDLSDRVTMTGPLDQGAVRELMSRATLLCLPCIVGNDGNRDALPTVLLEALAAGLPSISTPVTGIPEILDHGKAGVLVPESDPAATARAIEDLLGDAGRRGQISRVGRARAEQLFDAEITSEILSEWFEEALHRRPIPCESPA